MPMSAGAPPEGPSAGPLEPLSPAELAQRRAELQAQLDALGPVPSDQLPDSAPVSQVPEAAQPVSAVNMLGSEAPPRFDAQTGLPLDSNAAGAPSSPGMTYQGQPVVSPFTGAVPVPQPQAVGAPDAPADPNTDPNAPFSHWLHLADGKVIKALGTFTTWHENDDPRTPGIPVVASVANPAYVMGYGDVNSRRKSLIAELKALGFDLTDLFRS